jgi:hypothetical protein
MDNHFDKYIRSKLEEIEGTVVTSTNWEKEKAWKRLENLLRGEVKTISIKWFYAAAALILFAFFSGSMVFYYNHNKIISLSMQLCDIQNKYQTLLASKQQAYEVHVLKADTIKVNIHDTVFIASKEYVHVPVVLHDTVFIRKTDVVRDTMRLLTNDTGKGKMLLSSVKEWVTANTDEDINLTSQIIIKEKRGVFVNPNEGFDINSTNHSSVFAKRNSQ